MINLKLSEVYEELLFPASHFREGLFLEIGDEAEFYIREAAGEEARAQSSKHPKGTWNSLDSTAVLTFTPTLAGSSEWPQMASCLSSASPGKQTQGMPK